MKIAIDARFYGPEGAGLGKYTEKLLEHLQRIDKVNEYFVFLKKSNFSLFKPESPRFKKVLVDARWYSLKEQILIPRILNKLKPDLTHFLHYNVPLFWSGKFVVTIYDLTKLEFGRQASNINNSLIYLLKQAFHNLVLKKAVIRSEKIVAGSKSTKKKIIHHFQVMPGKIVPVYAAADIYSKKGPLIVNSKTAEAVIKKYSITKPFIIYVGNAYPYKNLGLILRAINLLEDVTLVYVSSRDLFAEKLMSEARKVGVGDRLVITGYVPDEDLNVLYNQAEAFVFPSLSEGFGLPGLEAMAAGCPVVASDIEVFKEIYGDAVVYFSAESAGDLAEKIKSILENQNIKKNIISRGFIQAKKYSWRKLANETLDIYKKV